MSIAVIFQVILAALKFPSEMTAFIKLLQATPDEKRQEITNAIQKQLDDFENTGRPS